jgi:hypothetical protein
MQAPAAAVVAEMVQDLERAADEPHTSRQSQQQVQNGRTINRGSEYQRLISLFLCCVEQTADAGQRHFEGEPSVT